MDSSNIFKSCLVFTIIFTFSVQTTLGKFDTYIHMYRLFSCKLCLI
ncbi:hypothetical protein Ccrd_011459 [Cynara cardunculus var. scolymus]|uniref:Uncharacterized protein n=1 Tax=Cynara cardunculus var. scolymus TaxID=59895 RepID=A0A103YJB5_CYNCS|nr:hypothetical protein Ccrd_011459 [Cynara cardunculus var. scolymus]